MGSFGVCLGRFSPIHKGHEAIIDRMLDAYGLQNSLIIIGSSNEPQSMRNFFSYSDRRDFIKSIYPTVKVIGLPDYNDVPQWLMALDDITESVFYEPAHNCEFFSGAKEDVIWFEDRGIACNYLDRHREDGPKISATQVRTDLLKGKPVNGLVNDLIVDDVTLTFNTRWEEFCKK